MWCAPSRSPASGRGNLRARSGVPRIVRRAPLIALTCLALCPSAQAVVVGCERRSGFDWPRTGPGDVVVGPLALLGAEHTPASTIREFGGDKLPALVRPGHRVRVALTRADRRHVSLGFGPMPEGEVRVRDGHRTVTFVSCPPGRDSGSTLDGEPVTFWMGFLLSDGTPRCVGLRVWIDDATAPRVVSLRLG